MTEREIFKLLLALFGLDHIENAVPRDGTRFISIDATPTWAAFFLVDDRFAWLDIAGVPGNCPVTFCREHSAGGLFDKSLN